MWGLSLCAGAWSCGAASPRRIAAKWRMALFRMPLLPPAPNRAARPSSRVAAAASLTAAKLTASRRAACVLPSMPYTIPPVGIASDACSLRLIPSAQIAI